MVIGNHWSEYDFFMDEEMEAPLSSVSPVPVKNQPGDNQNQTKTGNCSKNEKYWYKINKPVYIFKTCKPDTDQHN